MKTALIFIFNHRYDKNIEKLYEIYRDRFSIIRFIMPFYDGDNSDVIPVWESSACFQGYISQAVDKLMELECEYYAFIGDDVFIAPYLNERNICDEFAIGNKDVFIEVLYPINGNGLFNWVYMRNVISSFKDPRISWKDSLPDYDEAMNLAEQFFGRYDRNYGKKFFFSRRIPNLFKVLWFIAKNNKSVKVPYPMAMGYSDILIIKKEKLVEMATMMGVFAAMNLFVEIAIPTSVMLTTKRNHVAMLGDLRDKTRSLFWSKEEVEKFENENKRNISCLIQNWPKNEMYVHPIKLSKWEI